MMCADFLELGRDLDFMTHHQIDFLHMDIMDGHYAPNFTLGIDYCKAVASRCSIPQDVHLMVEDPDLHLEEFCKLPGARITFHPETSRHPIRTLEKIRSLGGSPGIAIDPATPIATLTCLLPMVDHVCVMSVNPGYAGQPLIPMCIDKIAELRKWLDQNKHPIDITVDGNVSWENIPNMIKAGANVLVCGTSSLFSKKFSREEAIKKLRNLIAL